MPYTPYQSTWQNPYLPLTNQGQPVMPMVQPYQQSVSGVIKVNGRDSALQYNLPPNSMSPALFDNNGQVFYIVSTDGTGTKTVEVFDFSPHVEEKPISIDGAQFVSRKEFDEFTTKGDRVVEMSMAVMEGDRFVVTEGPLKGREGMVTRVNRHKCLATIEMHVGNVRVQTTVGLAVVP